MDNKDAIIHATIALIIEKGEQLNDITVREISKKAGVGLGLINYHFENKDKLIEICVQRMVSDIVDQFHLTSDQTFGLPPYEKLEFLGNTTLRFLFEHYSISKISILSDMYSPKENDNTHRTYQAYIPIIAAYRPEWSEEKVKRKAVMLISTLQHAFLRCQEIFLTQGVNLTDEESRKAFHTQVLHDILEM